MFLAAVPSNVELTTKQSFTHLDSGGCSSAQCYSARDLQSEKRIMERIQKRDREKSQRFDYTQHWHSSGSAAHRFGLIGEETLRAYLFISPTSSARLNNCAQKIVSRDRCTDAQCTLSCSIPIRFTLAGWCREGTMPAPRREDLAGVVELD